MSMPAPTGLGSEMQADDSGFTGSFSAHSAEESLRLNPNCCYKACAGCSSIRRLRELQGRYSSDWPKRVIGSPRLLRLALQHDFLVSLPAADPGVAAISCSRVAAPNEAGEAKCDECGAFGAEDFGHVRLCAACHSVKGACCAD